LAFKQKSQQINMQNYLKVDSSVKAVRQVSSSRVLKEGFFWFFSGQNPS
jgi:hypothetical protein